MRTVDAAGLGIGDDHPPRIMGVLNVSRESPYKPSVFDDPAAAAAHADGMVDEGADIVDVGLESANKRLDVLSAEEELDRLDVAVEAIASVSGDPVFSIETRYHEVARAALDRGFDMVNDVCGFADPDLPRVCAERDAAVVKMASPADLARPGAVHDVDWATHRSPEWAAAADFVDRVYEALRRDGFTEKTIVDPAFGGWSEAKTLAEDRETFRRLREFRGLARPILVSINRKNFLRAVADRSTEAALPVSLGATAMAVERGAHVVRTHDVAETRDAALVGREFARRRTREPGDVAVEELDVTTAAEADRHLDRLGVDRDVGNVATRVFELAGLSDPDRAALEEAAAGTRAAVVHGCDGDESTDGGATLVIGTSDAIGALLAVVERRERASEALCGALERAATDRR
ncbi:MAG: dihydropteroate synthase [Haloferacaceae archaeon]